MDRLRKDNITLEEAMTKDVDHRIRIWSSPELNKLFENVVLSDENATYDHSFIVRASSTIWQVVICSYSSSKTSSNHFDIVNEFSSWEELKAMYPQLIALKGHLYAFP